MSKIGEFLKEKKGSIGKGLLWGALGAGIVWAISAFLGKSKEEPVAEIEESYESESYIYSETEETEQKD